MSGSPAYEQEKDNVVLFLQTPFSSRGSVRVVCGADESVIVECDAEAMGKLWLPRRPQALHEAETEYDELGLRIPPGLQPKCLHGVHVLEGWSSATGMTVSCYSCYRTFYWSMKRRAYIPTDVPGPLSCPSHEALQGFLGSSQRYWPDYVDAPLINRIRRNARMQPV